MVEGEGLVDFMPLGESKTGAVRVTPCFVLRLRKQVPRCKFFVY